MVELQCHHNMVNRRICKCTQRFHVVNNLKQWQKWPPRELEPMPNTERCKVDLVVGRVLDTVWELVLVVEGGFPGDQAVWQEWPELWVSHPSLDWMEVLREALRGLEARHNAHPVPLFHKVHL